MGKGFQLTILGIVKMTVWISGTFHSSLFQVLAHSPNFPPKFEPPYKETI